MNTDKAKKTEKAPKPGPEKIVRVTARRDGFRRAGREWHGTAEVPASQLSAGELAALRAEPMLAVEIVDAPDRKSGPEA